MPLKPKKMEGYAYASEMAAQCGVPYATILFYTSVGLLPNEQVPGKRTRRQYHVKNTARRMKDIATMKARGRSIADIVAHFAGA